MIEKGYYTKQQDKLVKKFKKTLKRYEPRLSAQYGQTFAETISTDAMAYFIELIFGRDGRGVWLERICSA